MGKPAKKKTAIHPSKLSGKQDLDARILALRKQLRDLETQAESINKDRKAKVNGTKAGKKLLARADALEAEFKALPKTVERRIPFNLILKAKIGVEKGAIKNIRDPQGYLGRVIFYEVTSDVETEGLEKKEAKLIRELIADAVADGMCVDELIPSVVHCEKLNDEAEAVHGGLCKLYFPQV
jgi:hypothetical protein